MMEFHRITNNGWAITLKTHRSLSGSSEEIWKTYNYRKRKKIGELALGPNTLAARLKRLVLAHMAWRPHVVVSQTPRARAVHGSMGS